MAEDIKIELPNIDLSDLNIDLPKIDIDKQIDVKDLEDNIKINLTKNNIIDSNKEEDSKKAVFNPLSFIRFIPEMLPAAVAMEAKDAELINQGKDPKFFPVRKGQADLARDIHKGILEGPILAVKGIAELATSGIDATLDTNFTKTLDTITRDQLEEHGNPQTWQGDVTKLVGEYGYPGTIAFKIVNNLGKINSVNKAYKKLRSSLSAIENKFFRRSAKFGTSIARRSGQAGLALGITDTVVKDSREDTYKIKKVSEEGKSGRDLAVARLLNKIKFGQEGTVIGAGFGLGAKALPFAAKYGIYKPGSVVLGTGFKAADKLILNPATQIIARTPGVRATAKGFNITADFLAKEVGGRVIFPFVSRDAFVKSFKAKLPPFNKWRTFSVTNSDPLKSALKKVDNKLQYLRSAANMTGEQFEITTAARNEIRRSARR